MGSYMNTFFFMFGSFQIRDYCICVFVFKLELSGWGSVEKRQSDRRLCHKQDLATLEPGSDDSY